MKFLSDHHAKLFLIEIEDIANIDEAKIDLVPTEKQLEIFLKKRKDLVPTLKSFRKKQNTKQQWRKNKYKIMKGIKRFHKSTTGKRFHRALGRFLATRECLNRANEYSLNMQEIVEVLKAMSSLKTHAYAELEYYHPVSEEIEIQAMIEDLIPTLWRIEKNLMSGDFSIDEDDENLLLRLVKEESVIAALEKRSQFSFDEIKETMDGIINTDVESLELESIDDVNMSQVLTRLKSAILETGDV